MTAPADSLPNHSALVHVGDARQPDNAISPCATAPRKNISADWRGGSSELMSRASRAATSAIGAIAQTMSHTRQSDERVISTSSLIGAGVAGAMVAYRLAQAGARRAHPGSRQPKSRLVLRWWAATQPLPRRRCIVPMSNAESDIKAPSPDSSDYLLRSATRTSYAVQKHLRAQNRRLDLALAGAHSAHAALRLSDAIAVRRGTRISARACGLADYLRRPRAVVLRSGERNGRRRLRRGVEWPFRFAA